MCLIIASPSGTLPDKSLLSNAISDNPHGWGLVVANNGKLGVAKGFKKADLDYELDALRENPVPYVIHYRWATHGEKNLDNCHPFKVRKDLYMAHNGVIQIHRENSKMSDTWHFVQWLKNNNIKPEELYSEYILKEIGDVIGRYNKLAFLDKDGVLSIVNESSGLWHKPDIWLSNGNSLPVNNTGWYSRHSSTRGGDKCGWSDEDWASYTGKGKKDDMILIPAPKDESTAKEMLNQEEDEEDDTLMCEICINTEADFLDENQLALCGRCFEWTAGLSDNQMEYRANAVSLDTTEDDDSIEDYVDVYMGYCPKCQDLSVFKDGVCDFCQDDSSKKSMSVTAGD